MIRADEWLLGRFRRRFSKRQWMMSFGGLGMFGGGVTEPWYLAGGVAAANCVAAYLAKGAASFAVSKVNLANPGTYDLADGTTPYIAPTWNATDGWIFVNANNTVLKPGFYPSSTSWSGIARFTGVVSSSSAPFGSYTNSSSNFSLFPTSTTNRYYGNGGNLTIAGTKSAGVMGLAGNKCYFDGAEETGTIGAGTIPAFNIGVGCYATNSTTFSVSTIKVQALAFYNATLSASQMAAITVAMQAL